MFVQSHTNSCLIFCETVKCMLLNSFLITVHRHGFPNVSENDGNFLDQKRAFDKES